MKVKDLIKELQRLNPNAKVVLGSDMELNQLYPEIQVEVIELKKGDVGFELELTPENVKNIKTIAISGYGNYEAY